jgi:hypothetical protein
LSLNPESSYDVWTGLRLVNPRNIPELVVSGSVLAVFTFAIAYLVGITTDTKR